MGKRSVLVWNNGKSQRTILHASGCALPKTSINQGQEGLTKFYIMFTEFFKELDRFHVCPAVATPHQWEECTNQPRGAVSTYMEDINSDDKDSVMLPLIYPEESNNEESLDEPPSAEPTPEPRTPSVKPTLQPKNWHRRVQSLSTKPLHRS